jgi:hypothetical protein
MVRAIYKQILKSAPKSLGASAVTVIVSVKINDGIIMASDSASTFATGQTYLTADKIVNLVKGLPIGVMVSGNGGIGSESIATLLNPSYSPNRRPHIRCIPLTDKRTPRRGLV